MVAKNPSSSKVTFPNDFLHLQADKVNVDSDFTIQFNNTTQPVSGEILIKREELRNLPDLHAVTIGFSTLGNILPTESENSSVNGLVMSVVLSAEPIKLELGFEKINKSSNINSHCAAWDGAQEKWTQDACQIQEDTKDHSLCKCTYSMNLLSFSIMMSPKKYSNHAINYITIIGLSISICSLLICLLIEGLVWKHATKDKTAYMRHVSIVNIALSLLISDIWFIVGGTIYKTYVSNICIASTFFTHLFYLCLFFWMLVLGIFIFYRIVLVFHDMRRTVMLFISFSLGYGCPFIISILTIAITLSRPDKSYTRDDGCWLNWDESKALLAFVIPVFLIIAVNAIVLLTVIIILLKPARRDNPRAKERSSIVQIGRCVAVLTPLLGLTWGFGIGTMIENSSEVFHYIFTILNAFQGLLILIFGTLMDKKNTSNSPRSEPLT
ncbi:hypothetical protein FKM82_011310 [Ascaphus truei]